jgi:hypothetical protein
MGTLKGFPNPPAMGSDGQSPSSPDAIFEMGTLRGFPNPPAMGSDGQSPSSPDAIDGVIFMEPSLRSFCGDLAAPGNRASLA